MEAYDCKTFEYGCPDSPYRGSTIFKCKKLGKINLCISFTYVEFRFASNILTFSKSNFNDFNANPHWN